MTACARLLVEKIRLALAESEGKGITAEAAKGYATALKILREVEVSEGEASRELLIKFEGGDETWTG